MKGAMTVLWCYLLSVNVLAFSCYGADKRRAKRNAWRIPERTLLLLAFAGGSLGAAAGMRVFHHKTKHTRFRVLVPLSLVLWCGIVAAAAWFLPLR